MSTPKINPESMRKAFDNLHDTFVRKNTDYGNSFETSLDKFGIVAGVVRMSDKWERLLSLTNSSEGPLVASESVSDTLLDLANYATMLAVYLQADEDIDITESIIYSGNQEICRIKKNKPKPQTFTRTVKPGDRCTVTYDKDKEVLNRASKIFSGTPVPPVNGITKGDFWVNPHGDRFVFDGEMWVEYVEEKLPTYQRMVVDAADKFMKIADFDMSIIKRVSDVEKDIYGEGSEISNAIYYSPNLTVWGKTFRVSRVIASDQKPIYSIGFGDDDNGWDYFSASDYGLNNTLGSYCDMLDVYIDSNMGNADFKMTCVRWLNRINYEKGKRNEPIKYVFNSKFESLKHPTAQITLTKIAFYITDYLSENEEVLGNTLNSLVLKDRPGLFLANNNDSILLLVLNKLITTGKMGKNTEKKYDFIPQEGRFVRLEDIESTVFRSDIANYLSQNTVFKGENLYFRDKND